jgi:hypothetical protein
VAETCDRRSGAIVGIGLHPEGHANDRSVIVSDDQERVQLGEVVAHLRLMRRRYLLASAALSVGHSPHGNNWLKVASRTGPYLHRTTC